jgi:hypothetical protein
LAGIHGHVRRPLVLDAIKAQLRNRFLRGASPWLDFADHILAMCEVLTSITSNPNSFRDQPRPNRDDEPRLLIEINVARRDHARIRLWLAMLRKSWDHDEFSLNRVLA